MTRLKQIPEGMAQSEAELRKQMKELWEENGFKVKCTSDNRRTRKQLKSLADFLIGHPDFPQGMQFAVEVKFGPDWSWSSESQEQAYYNKEIDVLWWLEDCQKWIDDKRRWIRELDGKLDKA
jgi:hypothetical protein